MTAEQHEEPKASESALSEPPAKELRGEHGPELDVPPNVRTLINSRRRVIE